MKTSDVPVGDRVGALVLADRLAEDGSPAEARWRALAGDEEALQGLLDADPDDLEARRWLAAYLAAAGDQRADGYAELVRRRLRPDPPGSGSGYWGWHSASATGAVAPAWKSRLPRPWLVALSGWTHWAPFASRREAEDAAATAYRKMYLSGRKGG